MKYFQPINKFLTSLDARIWVAGATAIAFGFTTYHIGARSLWFDEAYSVFTIEQDWPTFWSIVINREANQSLYYILLKFWNWLGNDEGTLRFFSAIFSTASVPIIYLVGKELFNKRTGIVSAYLLGVNGKLIYFGQEIRGYSLLLFLTLCSCFLAIKCVKAPSRKTWTWYVVVNVAGVYVHFFAVWIMLVHAVLIFFLPTKDFDWKGAFTSAVLIIVFLFPLMIFIINNDVGQISWIRTPNFDSIIKLIYSSTGNYGTSASDIFNTIKIFCFYVYLILCTIPIVYLIHSYIKSGSSYNTWRYAFLVCSLFLPITLVYSVSMLKPIFRNNYLIIVLPGFLLSAAFTLTKFKRVEVSFIASAIIVICSTLITLDSYESTKQEDWRGLAKYIHSSSINNDAILFYQDGGVVPFDYYSKKIKNPSRTYFYANPSSLYSRIFQPNPPSLNREWISNLAQNHRRLWFVIVYGKNSWQRKTIKKWLNRYYIEKEVHYFEGSLIASLYLNKNYIKIPLTKSLKANRL